MDRDLATALAAERAIVSRAVAEMRPIDGDWVVGHPPLTDIWHLNRVHLTGAGTGLDAAALMALVATESNSVSHHRVTLDDAGMADALWPALEARGWRGGLPASTATLYLDPDVDGRRVAFVDQVATLRDHRERGLARAVMITALRAAADWDADLVALFADADDRPQVFYAGLGFETVGRQTALHRDSRPGPWE